MGAATVAFVSACQVLVVEVEGAGVAMAVVLVLVMSSAGAEARTTTGGCSSVEGMVTSTMPAANTAATRAHISRLMSRG